VSASPAADRSAGIDSLHPVFRSFSALYDVTYAEGALEPATKELIALGISIARDCEPCAAYHIEQLRQLDVGDEQLIEALALSLMAAGSTTIPLIRRLLAAVAR
jgi:AhpD family alkylhydroperoxidase